MLLPADSPRARLEQALLRAYSLDQFVGAVESILQEPLYNFTTADGYRLKLTAFFNELEQRDDLRLRFLLKLRESANAELAGAINAYLGLGSAGADPYLVPLIFGRPYVDRKAFRDGLRRLLTSVHTPCMFVRGPRYSGRTLTAHFIQHVANELGLRAVQLDLQTHSLEDLVDRLVTEVGLRRENLRDRGAQPAAQAKGVAWELARRSGEFAPADGCCIIVDHYDVPTASPNARTFVDTLASNLVPPKGRRLWLVVLGHEGAVPVGTDFYSLKERLHELQRPDVVRWLEDWSTANGAPMPPDAREAACDEVLDGLALPLDPEADPAGLETMAARLYDLTLR